MKYLISVLFGLLTISAIAQVKDVLPEEHQKFQNGCGTGWNSYLVPNEIPLAGCKFEQACNAHDLCYSKCVSKDNLDNPLCKYKRCWTPGDLKGKKICQDPEYGRLVNAAVERKNTCDQSFYNKLVSDNQNVPICDKFARIYRYAVSKLGGDAFNGLGVSFGLTSEQQRNNREAIGKLLTTWPQSRIEGYVAEMEAGRKVINWNKELKFDQDIGLVQK